MRKEKPPFVIVAANFRYEPKATHAARRSNVCFWILFRVAASSLLAT
ncbi:MAG: hypothetical protein ACJAXT_001439, partial [Paracoccaceae bacterium]